jgi:hypothetical protein
MRSSEMIKASAVLLLLMTLAGCGGKPFNVKARPDTPPPLNGARVEGAGFIIEAEPVTDEDHLYDTFDANLILAGVLPVHVKLTNGAQDSIDTAKAKFEIRAGPKQSYKAIAPRDAYKKLISYYEISTYSKSGYKESRDDFASHALDMTRPLAAGESRQGLVFFAVPAEVARQAGLTLVARRLGKKDSRGDQAFELKLN